MSWAFWTGWAKRFRWQLVIISSLTLASSLATLAVPWLAAQLLGGVVASGDESSSIADLPTILGLLVAALVGLTILNIGAAIASRSASLSILTELRKQLYAHVQLLPLGYHDGARAGEVLALTSYEVGNLSNFLANTLANVPAMLLTAIGAIVILFWIDPVIAIAVPLLIPIFYLALKMVGRRLRQLSGDMRAAEVDLIALAERDLSILPAIKAFASEETYRAEFANAADKSRRLAIRQSKLSSAIGPVVMLVAALAVIAALMIGSDRLASGQSAPSDIFAFLLYAALLTRPIGGLANIYGSYQMASGTLARLETVLDVKPEPGYASGSEVDRLKGSIEFRSVSFSYPERPPVLENVNLSVNPGETVALTGANGAGKSTLVRLLMRFYTPTSGSILIDGQDIASIQLQQLRRQFGYVPQRALLFNGTIAENIAIGASLDVSENTRAAIERAARLAQADDFIRELPHGLDTEIGDHGVKLSGGQRQRIALARALFRDPPIFILDEATSMYDLESEAAFVEDCIAALGDRTVLIITHRPASLALADRIMELTADGISALPANDALS